MPGDQVKAGESLLREAKEELRHYLATAPRVQLIVAVEDFKKVRRLHNELLSWFRTRFGEYEKWPMWARGAALPLQQVLIGARKRVERELERERERRQRGGKSEQATRDGKTA